MVLWKVPSRVIAGLGFLGSALLWSAAAVQAQEPPKPPQIVFNDSGGDMQKAMRESFYSEFEKQFGIRVVTTSPVDAGKLKAMVESGNIEWTVTEIGPEEAMLAEKEGLLEPLDRAAFLGGAAEVGHGSLGDELALGDDADAARDLLGKADRVGRDQHRLAGPDRGQRRRARPALP